ncbi:hypothetical protein L1987_86920 [Smallanthus sonchifolius]|uniref:Uncharacterized protein n=1 Tax=Smallanthus sonchifolius TaxID=185202 RepID=A0ACB8Y0T2_9ASTR|nr:hypothetical protein L1987_86920 [Smallanthus sonchifolius]
MSKYPKICNNTKIKKDLYDMLVKGILVQDGKVLFSLGSNGERNEMISARMFSYKNTSYKWQSVPESRFRKVAEMFDISKLKIKIKIKSIEFRVIDNVMKNEEREKVQQILKSNSNKDQLLSVNEIVEKEHLMLSAMEVLYDSSNSKYFHLQSSAESRQGWESSLFVYVLVKSKRVPS